MSLVEIPREPDAGQEGMFFKGREILQPVYRPTNGPMSQEEADDLTMELMGEMDGSHVSAVYKYTGEGLPEQGIWISSQFHDLSQDEFEWEPPEPLTENYDFSDKAWLGAPISHVMLNVAQ